VNGEVASFDVSGKGSQESKENLQRNIRHLQKRKKAEIPEDSSFFTNFVLPSAVKSENKPDRAATAADREVAVIPAAPFIPNAPRRFQSLPTPPDSRS
jgi:hypothetical protein